jgi:hypothetical protein
MTAEVPAKRKPAKPVPAVKATAIPISEPIPVSEPIPAEDKPMTTTAFPTIDFSSAFTTAFADAQAQAKAAYEKSSAAFAEAGTFAKGNVEAVVESGKVFAGGLQELGSTLVADSRSAFETLTAEVKELAAAKSPTDFVKLQGDLLRKHFDESVAYASKHSEAMLKLVSEAMSPLSGRVSLAVETLKKAA